MGSDGEEEPDESEEESEDEESQTEDSEFESEEEEEYPPDDECSWQVVTSVLGSDCCMPQESAQIVACPRDSLSRVDCCIGRKGKRPTTKITIIPTPPTQSHNTPPPTNPSVNQPSFRPHAS